MKKLLTALFVVFAVPAAAQQAPLTPMQQYLYNESGYAPPVEQPVQQVYEAPVYPQQQAYVPVPAYQAPDGYYEDESSEVGPSSESPSLRAMMTSSGF